MPPAQQLYSMMEHSQQVIWSLLQSGWWIPTFFCFSSLLFQSSKVELTTSRFKFNPITTSSGYSSNLLTQYNGQYSTPVSQTVHRFLRNLLPSFAGQNFYAEYGGSRNAANCQCLQTVSQTQQMTIHKPKVTIYLQVSAHWRWLQIAHNQRLCSNVRSYNQSLAICFFTMTPYVNGQRHKVRAGWYHEISQENWVAKVKDNKSPCT